eukprot:m.53447 g.53447  ORF g.53447 m.53447 type:complete len:124 (-) comp10866_c0_seq4:1902-2273(-)
MQNYVNMYFAILETCFSDKQVNVISAARDGMDTFYKWHSAKEEYNNAEKLQNLRSSLDTCLYRTHWAHLEIREAQFQHALNERNYEEALVQARFLLESLSKFSEDYIKHYKLGIANVKLQSSF